MRLQNSWPLSRLWGFYSCGSLASCSSHPYWMTAHFSKDWTPYPWDYSPHAFSLFLLRTLFFLFRELIPSVFDVIKPHSMKVMTPSGERPWPRDYTPTLSLFFFYFFLKSFFCSRQPCELLICPVLDDIKANSSRRKRFSRDYVLTLSLLKMYNKERLWANSVSWMFVQPVLDGHNNKYITPLMAFTFWLTSRYSSQK